MRIEKVSILSPIKLLVYMSLY